MFKKSRLENKQKEQNPHFGLLRLFACSILLHSLFCSDSFYLIKLIASYGIYVPFENTIQFSFCLIMFLNYSIFAQLLSILDVHLSTLQYVSDR